MLLAGRGALGHGPQHLHHEQGVPSRGLHDPVGHVGSPEACGKLRHGGPGQRADLQSPADLVETGERFLALLDADGGQDEESGSRSPPHEEVKELEGGGPGLMEVVQEEQEGPPFRQ